MKSLSFRYRKDEGDLISGDRPGRPYSKCPIFVGADLRVCPCRRAHSPSQEGRPYDPSVGREDSEGTLAITGNCVTKY